MKKYLIVFFILLIIIFGTIIAFIASPEKEDNTQLASSQSEILYFYSDTCSYCIKQKPIVEELSNEGVKFKYMNVGENRSYWQDYEIQGTPTFIFKDKRLQGYQSKEKIRKFWEDNK